MSSSAVIEHFNVICDVPAGIVSGLVNGKEDPLCFQAAEKTLSYSIVPAISFTTHAADHPIGL